jgi:ABC-type dipeptide/oligopeptide/nickel transport system ATPase component
MYAGQIVERGPAEESPSSPAHPYTQLLIASAPDPDNLGSVLEVEQRDAHDAGRRGVHVQPDEDQPGHERQRPEAQ